MTHSNVTPETTTTPEATQTRVSAKLLAKGKEAVAKNTRALQTLVVSYTPHGSLRPNYYNPNRQSDHDFELLTRSMTEDGFTQPIVAVRITAEHLANPEFAKHYKPGDQVICDGEHRWRAAAALGFTEVPVVFVPMTVEQMMTATLRHNRARGSEDIELAANVLKDLQALGALDWAKDSLMLDDAELNKLLNDVPATEAMANAEFGEAWRPAPTEVAKSATASVTESPTQGTVVAAATVGQLEQQRVLEAKLAAAKTEEEKRKALADNQVFRLHLTFAGDEGKVVKGVLGDKPAEKLLALCRAALDAQPA